MILIVLLLFLSCVSCWLFDFWVKIASSRKCRKTFFMENVLGCHRISNSMLPISTLNPAVVAEQRGRLLHGGYLQTRSYDPGMTDHYESRSIIFNLLEKWRTLELYKNSAKKLFSNELEWMLLVKPHLTMTLQSPTPFYHPWSLFFFVSKSAYSTPHCLGVPPFLFLFHLF